MTAGKALRDAAAWAVEMGELSHGQCEDGQGGFYADYCKAEQYGDGTRADHARLAAARAALAAFNRRDLRGASTGSDGRPVAFRLLTLDGEPMEWRELHRRAARWALTHDRQGEPL